MNEKKEIKIRVLGTRKEYASLDARDESQVAKIIRTQVLPKTKAEYYRVDVKIKRKSDKKPNKIVATLLRKDIYLAEVVKVDVESDYQVTGITWDYDESKEEEEEEDYSLNEEEYACSYDFVVGTPVDGIPTAKEAVEYLHNLFTTLGYKSKMLLGAEATLANYKQYLTCGLKGFVNIGHGNTNGIVLDDGTLSASWFNSVTNQALKPAVTYFNSCQVHNDPLKSAVMKAGTRTFIGGITNLLIGPSELVCKCFWDKVQNTATTMDDALHTCEKEKYPNEGAHGIIGDSGLFMGSTMMKIAAGKTKPDQWQQYPGGKGIFVDVDTSSAKFSETPIYVTSIHGSSSHWATTGASSVYLAKPTGFRIYIRWVNYGPLTPAQAIQWKWHIQWIGIEA